MSGIGDIGGAVSDIFSAAGALAEASAYGEASSIASSNALLTLRSGQIQEQQEGIAITKALGGEKASTAGAGFVNGSGSATDLLRSSTQQGALSKQLLSNQTEITAQGYEQQAAAYKGQEKAANMQAAGDAVGGVLKVASAVATWIICTELLNQGRMPRRWYVHGAAVFDSYPAEVKEGYHVWAVHCVRHLRRYPLSLFSCFLSAVFNWRAENIAGAAGAPGARGLWRGRAVTAVLWPACFAIGWMRLKLNKRTNWSAIYGR